MTYEITGIRLDEPRYIVSLGFVDRPPSDDTLRAIAVSRNLADVSCRIAEPPSRYPHELASARTAPPTT